MGFEGGGGGGSSGGGHGGGRAWRAGARVCCAAGMTLISSKNLARCIYKSIHVFIPGWDVLWVVRLNDHGGARLGKMVR